MAEILAIHKAWFLPSTKEFLLESDIMIVSDSKVAVSWVNNEDFGSLRHVNIVYDMCSLARSFGNIKDY